MIPRYAPAEMAELFTDRARFAAWLEVELLATEGWGEIGEVPAEVAAACRARAPKVDDGFVEAVADRERVTDHDVAAFVDVVQGAIGAPEGSWIHYGLTSSDVVDTALCATLAEAADLLITAAARLVGALEGTRARMHRHAGDRPHPRDARGADHLRGQVLALGPPGGPRSSKGSATPANGWRSGSCPARSGPIRTSTRGSRPTSAVRSASLRCRPPRSSPATATPSTSMRARRSGPPSRRSPPRCAISRAASSVRRRSRSPRVRRAARRCPTSATRSSPSGCPGWHACCAATCRQGSRTSRSGTSATSPTARSNGWCSPTPRC